MRKNSITKLLISGVALAALVLGGLAVSAPHASAAAPYLQLYNQSYDNWGVTGGGFTPGETDAQVYFADVTSAFTIIDHQTGLHVSQFSTECIGKVCRVEYGGILVAEGPLGYVPPAPGIFSGYYAEEPLLCGHNYEAIAVDPGGDGGAGDYVVSNIVTEPACPTPPG